MTDENKRRLQVTFSDWKLWMAVAYFLLVWVSVAALVDYSHANKALDGARAIQIKHEAELVASHNARVAGCLESIPTLRNTDLFLDSVRVFQQVVAQNALATLAATPLDSPVYQVRLHNYQRLKAALPGAEKIHFDIPTEKSCRQK